MPLASSLTVPLLLLGFLYVIGSMVTVRGLFTDALIDVALAGITARPPDPLDRERALWLFAGATVVGAGGLLLMIGSALAAPVFLLACLLQTLHYALLSPRRYDRDEPVDPAFRRRSLRAYRLYLAVSAFVAWAAASGVLRPPGQGSPWPLLLVGSVWLVASGWALVRLRRLGRGQSRK